MISLCERLAGQDANVTTVPVSILRLTRQLTRFFEWTNDVADRLSFSEVLFPHKMFYEQNMTYILTPALIINIKNLVSQITSIDFIQIRVCEFSIWCTHLMLPIHCLNVATAFLLKS